MHEPSRVDVREASVADRDAAERLLVRYLGPLRGFVRLNAGPTARARESCSDVVQSVCREVLTDLSGFEYRGEAAFRHWLFKRAYHKILQKNRFHQQARRDIGREARPERWRGTRLCRRFAVRLRCGYDLDELGRRSAALIPEAPSPARERAGRDPGPP